MTDYQRKLIAEGAPACKVCGLRLPAAIAERGVCDFCTQAGYLPDGTYPATWPEDIIGGADARAYEERGGRAYITPPRYEIPGGVIGEPLHTRDERRAAAHTPRRRLSEGSFWRRVTARATEGRD